MYVYSTPLFFKKGSWFKNYRKLVTYHVLIHNIPENWFHIYIKLVSCLHNTLFCNIFKQSFWCRWFSKRFRDICDYRNDVWSAIKDHGFTSLSWKHNWYHQCIGVNALTIIQMGSHWTVCALKIYILPGQRPPDQPSAMWFSVISFTHTSFPIVVFLCLQL